MQFEDLTQEQREELLAEIFVEEMFKMLIEKEKGGESEESAENEE